MGLLVAVLDRLTDVPHVDRADRELDARLVAKVAEAQKEWPALALDDVDFGAFLLERAERRRSETEPDLREIVASTHASDLYLVFGIARGHGGAFATVDAICRAELEKAARGVRGLPLELDDVQQLLRERLFVGTEAAHRKILDYTGAGALRVWLRVTITRTLLNLVTRETKEAPTEDVFFEAITDGVRSPELALAKSNGQADLKGALAAAAAQLSTRDACLLRYAYGDKRTFEQIGAIYGVHGTTASRWVTEARAALVTLVKNELGERLRLDDGEVQSLLRNALQSLELTLSGLLGRPSGQS
jgi:RNA polymerase sigma-70 factor (ECF subfamily)